MSKKDTPLNAQEYLEKKRQERDASYVQHKKIHKAENALYKGWKRCNVSW